MTDNRGPQMRSMFLYAAGFALIVGMPSYAGALLMFAALAS